MLRKKIKKIRKILLNKDNTKKNIKLIRDYFDSHFYLENNPDVADNGVDPLVHYCEYGWREGRDPNAEFSIHNYINSTPGYNPDQGDPLLHAIKNNNYPCVRNNNYEYIIVPNTDKYILVQSSSKQLEVIRQNIDVEFYLNRYPDVKRANTDPALHYATIGWLMGYDPSPEFSTHQYLEINSDVKHLKNINPFYHYIQYGRKEGRYSVDVATADAMQAFNESQLVSDIANAIALEPMVALPEGSRIPVSPVTSNKHLQGILNRLRSRFEGLKFTYIITIPHVRMSGAARVAGEFVHALTKARPDKRFLIVMTEASDFEHPEWFPEDSEFADISKFWYQDMPKEEKVRVLLDLVHGVEAQAVINVNSRLFWDMLGIYGRQLSQQISLGTYLFTWEETSQKTRVGYPIQWLRESVNYLDAIACDNGSLANYVAERFGFEEPKSSQGAVHILRIPMRNAGETLINKSASRTRRVLWAGRFDRQKRPDILQAIAAASPDIQFDVYGRAVLDKGLETQLEDLPNVHLKGEFSSLDEVVEGGYAVFLYTAQWDGIPTIILDAIRNGLPIIAPDVGGISEVIGPRTGWLIDDFEDIDAYIAALDHILRAPEEVTERVQAAYRHAQSMFNIDAYIRSVELLMDHIESGNKKLTNANKVFYTDKLQRHNG